MLNINEYTVFYESPIGFIKITSDDTFVTRCKFVEKEGFTTELPDILSKALAQIDQYFSKERKEFDLLIAPPGTEFQQKVWLELLRIPYGEATSYKELALKIGNDSAVRAVGYANSMNPINIIIPCHRVLGNDGGLVGYRGGLERKKWLLDFEKK